MNISNVLLNGKCYLNNSTNSGSNDRLLFSFFKIQTGASFSVAKLITYFALQQGINLILLVRSKHSGEHLERELPGENAIANDVDSWPQR